MTGLKRIRCATKAGGTVGCPSRIGAGRAYFPWRLLTRSRRKTTKRLARTKPHKKTVPQPPPVSEISCTGVAVASAGAWTVTGLLKGITAGKNAKGIHYQAAKAFAAGKKKPLSAILNAFTYGD